jgi:group II intron reverse transcriptase/maturase
MNPTSDILVRIINSSSNHPDGAFTRLYRYLLREDIYMTGYKNLYANNGASTKGTDNDTADGFSVEYVQAIINDLRNLTYTPKPVRRVYIPKKNGKLRPLGVPSFRDKLVQDAIRQILEAIYEPIFSYNSHGFRPRRSCHTALKQVNRSFRGSKWFIEGDIKGCFDNIDHSTLLDILSMKIKDSKFLNLIGKFLKAGYMENWRLNATYSGTPQGGILSPILANIYLNELDKKIEAMQKAFRQAPERAYSSAYCEANMALRRLEGALSKAATEKERSIILLDIHRTKVSRRKLPYNDCTDRKISYVRYADDFLIGVKGNKEDCIRIKQELKVFISDTLKMELSDEKTKITHSSEYARFLGYDICIRRNDECKRKSNGTVQRTLNNSVELLVPLKDKIEPFLFTRGIARTDAEGKLESSAREAMVGLSDLEILDTYNAQTRGICNYYGLASNFAKLTYFVYLMEYSCLKTLAMKHKSHISKIKQKYHFGKSWGIPYETKTGTRRMMIIKFSDMGKTLAFDDGDELYQPGHIHYSNVNSLEARLRGKCCELCGKNEGKFEIHHVHRLKDLTGKEQWERAMIARRRKTLVLCEECHVKVHKPDRVVKTRH